MNVVPVAGTNPPVYTFPRSADRTGQYLGIFKRYPSTYSGASISTEFGEHAVDINQQNIVLFLTAHSAALVAHVPDDAWRLSG